MKHHDDPLSKQLAQSAGQVINDGSSDRCTLVGTGYRFRGALQRGLSLYPIAEDSD